MASSLPTILLIAVVTFQVALATYAYYPPCDPPHSPSYGGYGPIKSKYPVGSKIKYYCNDGYRQHGASWTVCRYNKRSYWANPPPVCKRKLLKSMNFLVLYSFIILCIHSYQMPKPGPANLWKCKCEWLHSYIHSRVHLQSRIQARWTWSATVLLWSLDRKGTSL